jgi:hypothetical protein
VSKLNCWEVMQCGRQPGGNKTAELGVCPAAVEVRLNGLNGGLFGGRACWGLAGTFCGGKVQGTFAGKVSSCTQCRFHNLVCEEEGDQLVPIKEILTRLS